jgi:RNase H-like domain found in reverse transcriptase
MIQMDPAKVKGVADWPPPQDPTKVYSFLGFTGFYHYFIPNYSRITWPLLDLTKKAVVWQWRESHFKAFKTLKTLMCSRPILTQPQYNKPFVVHTDALAYGVGAILLQEGEINPQKLHKPHLYPIAYYSTTFTPTERNYDIYERELLVVIKALQNWRPHLAWTMQPFTLVMDHANLTYWKYPRKVNRQVARWFTELQGYWFEIKHTSGKPHAAANFLSRPFTNDKGEQDNENVIILPLELFIQTMTTMTQSTVPLWEAITDAQAKHEQTMKEWQATHDIRKEDKTPQRLWMKEGAVVIPLDEEL